MAPGDIAAVIEKVEARTGLSSKRGLGRAGILPIRQNLTNRADNPARDMERNLGNQRKKDLLPSLDGLESSSGRQPRRDTPSVRVWAQLI
jgi:hypothetical protein